MDSEIAHKMWELSNNVTDLVGGDEIYYYNQKAQQNILQAKPWDKDPHYFKEVKVSALALLRMVMHAKSGGSLEVMGLLQGKVDGRALIVMDAFALPVEGTETRVNAHQQAYEFMVHYIETARECGRLENVVGWYHSHPGYGCWLSGIDVATQMAHQQFEDPYVAIVIDPIRTVSAGKVNMGAFRTYPKGFKPPDDGVSEYQSIPLSKIEDFGVHCKSYYALELSYFKSSLDKRLLDSLWHRYWISTLSGNALLSNFDYANSQLFDLADKLEQAEQQVQRGLPQQRATVFDPLSAPLAGNTSADKAEDKLAKTVRDGCMHVTEMLDGLMAQAIKNELFRQCFAKRGALQQQASQPSTSATPATSAGTSGSQQSAAISTSISSNTLQMDTN